MKIETELQADHQMNVVVEIEQDLLEKHKHRAVRAISKQAKIPGFRPGKAPYAVLLRHFGEEAILEEALESLVNEVYPKIIDETGVHPFGPGALNDILSKEPPKFSFTIPLMPEVNLCDYRTIRKDYDVESATKEEVDQVLMNLQVQQAVTEPLDDRPVQSGDMVQLKISQVVKNPDEGQETNISEGMPQSVYFNEKYDHKDSMPYQGFMNELVGLNVGDEKTLIHTYNEIEEDDELFGKDVEISFVVEAISSAELPEINEEFAQTVNPEFVTVDDLRKSIAEQIESYRKQRYDNEYLTALMDEIVSASPVKYPPQLFDAEAEAYLEQTEHELSHQGMEFEAYLKLLEKTREEFIEDKKEEIVTKIHRVLVLEEISRKEEIKINPDELQASVAETTMRYGLYQYLSQLPKQRADEIAQRITMDAANQILNDKLMHRLIDIGSGKIEVDAENASELEGQLEDQQDISEETVVEESESES